MSPAAGVLENLASNSLELYPDESMSPGQRDSYLRVFIATAQLDVAIKDTDLTPETKNLFIQRLFHLLKDIKAECVAAIP